MSGIEGHTDPPDESAEVLFRFRLYDAKGGEIGTFATTLGDVGVR